MAGRQSFPSLKESCLVTFYCQVSAFFLSIVCLSQKGGLEGSLGVFEVNGSFYFLPLQSCSREVLDFLLHYSSQKPNEAGTLPSDTSLRAPRLGLGLGLGLCVAYVELGTKTIF